ncbi:MAG: flagellar motor protein MotB [Bacteroidetes bacterium]|nr:flagellar motor protein MotB [Bacteroidota bacterium]
MKRFVAYGFLMLAISVFGACVAKSKLIDAQMQYRTLQTDSSIMASKIIGQEDLINKLKNDINALNQQNTQLNTDASNKVNSLQQNLQDQQKKLQDLQNLLNQQRNKTADLKNKMMNALKGFSDSDLTITQKNGKVYISLSEKFLFPSASAVVNDSGKVALNKLATVLIANPDISVDIEGHTDSIPIRGKFKDNWDLSTARAVSVVRILVNDYKVDPTRVIASGHSWFDPVDTNVTPEGRAHNRRTEIILSPKLDEIYKLLEQ